MEQRRKNNEDMHMPKNRQTNLHESKHNKVIAQDAVAVYQPEAIKTWSSNSQQPQQHQQRGGSSNMSFHCH